jgi:GNAT superfamily N-acetyltransferase
MWVPPGCAPVAEDQEEAFFTALAECAGEDADRLFEIASLVEERRPSGSFHYLEFLGVDPAVQGRGIGSALLVAMLERCDREGAAAFLDATSIRNRALYHRHGFRTIGELAPHGGPTLWQMWREPQS